MPKAASRKSGPQSTHRHEPYPKPGNNGISDTEKQAQPLHPSSIGKQNASNPKPALNEDSTSYLLEEHHLPFSHASDFMTKKRSPIPLAYSKAPTSIPSPSIPEKAKSFLDIEIPCPEGKEHPPIYETCSQVRQKINRLLNDKNPSAKDGVPNQFKKDGKPKPWTVAEFARASGNSNNGSHHRFMKATGRMGGCHSSTYVTAYLFFEKKRIWEKAPKSAARKKCEGEHPGGLDMWDPKKDKLLMTAEERRTGMIKGVNC